MIIQMRSIDHKEIWQNAYYDAIEDGYNKKDAEEIANKEMQDWFEDFEKFNER
jgi:hypothetical protein